MPASLVLLEGSKLSRNTSPVVPETIQGLVLGRGRPGSVCVTRLPGKEKSVSGAVDELT